MTKTEAQNLYSAYLADRAKIAKHNAIMNDGGYGYESEANTSAIDAIRAAGYRALISTGKVYSREDLDAMRATWNTAVQSVAGKADISDLEHTTGLSFNSICALKGQFSS